MCNIFLECTTICSNTNWQLCTSLPTQVEGEEVVEVVVEWDEEGVEGTWAWLEKPFV